MMPLRPYAWINEPSSTSSPKTLYVRINCTSATLVYDLPTGGLVQISPAGSSILVLECRLTSGSSSSGGEQTTQFEIAASSSYKKVKIIVTDGSVEKGTVTLKLAEAHFSPTNIKPHCWIKLTSVANTEVFFWLQPGINASLTGPTITTNSITRIVTLDYTITSGTETYFERNFPLSGYDPTTYEYVEVKISQGGTLKGKGTTSQTDADSSDDD